MNSFQPNTFSLQFSSEKNTPASRLLIEMGVDRKRVLEAIMKIRGGQRVTDRKAETRYRTLEKFSRDLTAFAHEKKLGSGHWP